MNEILKLGLAKVSAFEIKIGSVNLIQENITSAELTFNNSTPAVYCQIVYDDVLDTLTKIKIDDEVDISYVDALGVVFHKIFRIIGSEDNTSGQRKTGILQLQDKFSYELSNSFLSKGYTDLVSGLKSILTLLEIDSIPDLEYDLDYAFSTEAEETPGCTLKTITNLDYFLQEFYRAGVSFYQDKTGVRLKTLDDLSPSNLGEPMEFVESPINEFYFDRVFKYDVKFGEEAPIFKSMYFDTDNRVIKYDDVLPKDKIELNGNFKTRPYNYYLNQGEFNFNKRNLRLKRILMEDVVIDIYTNGKIGNRVNRLYNLNLLGNIGSVESITSGNQKLSGLYMSKKVQDIIINGTLMQKVTLCRADSPEYEVL